MLPHAGFHHTQGPENAKGVIVWSPGAGENLTHPKAASGRTPHFLDWLYGHGWDVFFVERRGTLLISDRDEHSSALQNAVNGLKRAGYQRVVLAGQSSGGTYSMLAAQGDIDVAALMLFASGPSGGPLTFYQMLEGSKAPRFVVAHFKNDQTIGSRSGVVIEHILKDKNVPYLNIFEPENHEGHGAAFKGRFSKRFGDCILQFLDADNIRTEFNCS